MCQFPSFFESESDPYNVHTTHLLLLFIATFLSYFSNHPADTISNSDKSRSTMRSTTFKRKLLSQVPLIFVHRWGGYSPARDYVTTWRVVYGEEGTDFAKFRPREDLPLTFELARALFKYVSDLSPRYRGMRNKRKRGSHKTGAMGS